MKFFIAGVQHHDFAKVINELEEGDELDLIPEPTNKFDPNAIKIMYGDTMLGYVPKKLAPEVGALLETATLVSCPITTLNKSAKPWEMIEVTVSDESELADDYDADDRDDDELYPDKD